jgi:hypothetical protein
MSGRYLRLRPGRYTLDVTPGEGPAGVHRGDGTHIVVWVDGGRAAFTVRDEERVYLWWRGRGERPGVRLLGVARGRDPGRARGRASWTTATAG